MRVGAITNAFRCSRWIDGCARQFANTGIDHLVLCNRRSWNANLEWDWDTLEAAFASGAKPMTGFWPSAQDQYNWGLGWFQQRDYDWVLLVDADERWTAADLRVLLDELEETDHEVVRTSHRIYWKSLDYRIDPMPTDDPYIAFRPHVRVENIRWPGPRPWLQSRARMHHLSYVRTDEEMLQKITANDDFRGCDADDLRRWYDEKWLGWTPDLEDLHPRVPTQFKRAIWAPAPAEVIGLL